MNKKEIKFVPSSREAQIGLGVQFPGIGGYWNGEEMKSNHRKSKLGVPCAEWDEEEGRYRYYVLEA